IANNLPCESTPFHGRREELDDLTMALASPDVRLLTLTGLGGMGKTRLALAAARHFIRAYTAIPPRFPAGVWFVSLAEVESDDEETLARAILQSCGGRPLEGEPALGAVIRHLEGEACLLILDNLEHLPAARDFVADLLHKLPNLTLLATSRHALELRQEIVRHLDGLPVPADAHDVGVASMSMLVERLQRLDDGFRLTPAVIPSLIHICRTLDGWPLALELAAGWAASLPLSDIAERVVTSIAVLTTTMPDVSPRHRSIEAVLNGSYLLLTPAQQRILAGLSIFQGGCDLNAVEAILRATLDDLTMLVRRALIRQNDGRYTMHELVYQFARQKLVHSGEQERVAKAYATYYLHLLTSQQKALYSLHPLPAVQRLRSEQENITRAWLWAAEHGEYGALSAALPALIRFYLFTGWDREGEALLRKTRTFIPSSPLAIDILLAQITFCQKSGNYDETQSLLESLPPWETLSPVQQMEAHLSWARVFTAWGKVSAARKHWEHALRLAREINHYEAMAVSLNELESLNRYDGQYMAEIADLREKVRDLWVQRELDIFAGGISIHHRRYRDARDYWQDALEISLELEDGATAAVLYNNLGDVLRELGEFEQSEAAYQKALEFGRKYHFGWVRRNVLEGWARLCVLRGEYEQAVAMLKEAVQLWADSKERYGEVLSYICLGHAYAGLQRWALAKDAYHHAMTILPDMPHLALESLAGLAYICWKEGNEHDARAYVARFLAALEHTEFAGFASPDLSYARVTEVLQALGEKAQAETLLSRSLSADASAQG
ncbi:MAG: hypothetical protein D6755_01790, partial [Anaerolineae bacterium]